VDVTKNLRATTPKAVKRKDEMWVKMAPGLSYNVPKGKRWEIEKEKKYGNSS